MGSVEVCPQCGWTFDIEHLRMNQCKKCGSALLITSVAYLEKFDRPAIQKYISHYSQELKRDPEDRDALLGLGICYLRLELFEIADKYLGRLVDSHPDEAAGYYYKAIGCLKGRRPRTQSLNIIRAAEQFLLTAMALEPDNGRQDVVLAAMRHDYYALNGLTIPDPGPVELLQGAASKHLDLREIAQGLALMKIPESPVYSVIPALRS